jgi:inner membrane protein
MCSDMDTITHALFVWMVFLLAGIPDLILFGMLGATLLDIDILFTHISDRYPKQYIFTHGGFVHSLFGATFVATGVIIGLVCIAGAGSVFGYVLPAITAAAFASIIAGALLHLALDVLAYPGIPLLYPISDEKYTIGIFPGPSIVLLVASSAFLVLTLLGIGTLADMRPYAVGFLLFLAISVGVRAYVAMSAKGTPVPTRDPLRWILIHEAADFYRVEFFTIFQGITEKQVFLKYAGTTAREIEPYLRMPEVRRHRYHSYLSTAEKTGNVITFHDPLRELGYILYPPYYTCITLPLGEPSFQHE